MIRVGVLFTALLACLVAAENVDPSVPAARHLISRIRRQNAGGDPNLEGIFGQQAGNGNPSQFGNNGQSGSAGREALSWERGGGPPNSNSDLYGDRGRPGGGGSPMVAGMVSNGKRSPGGGLLSSPLATVNGRDDGTKELAS